MTSNLLSGELFNLYCQPVVLLGPNFTSEKSTESSYYKMLLCLNSPGDASSHAQEQYESMDADEGGETGPARCKSLDLFKIMRPLH